MRHVTCMNESCHMYEWVTSRIWISQVTHLNEWARNISRHTYEWVMSHVWMSHVTCMNESCHTHSFEWVSEKYITSHVWMSRITANHATSSWQRRDRGVYRKLCVDSFTHMTWLIYMWHDSLIRVTWLIHILDGQVVCWLNLPFIRCRFVLFSCTIKDWLTN